MSVKQHKSRILDLYVTDEHIEYKGQFIMHCYALGIATYPLCTATSLEEAWTKAKVVVQSKLSSMGLELAKIGELDV